MLFGGGSVFAEGSSEKDKIYPIRPGTKQWNNLNTHNQKINICQIPDELLYTMSTDKLIDIILEYPLLTDIYAFNTLEDGLLSVTNNFNGLQELQRRDDKIGKLINKYESVPIVDSFETSENTKNIFNITFLEVILGSNQYLEYMSREQQQKFEEIAFIKYQKRNQNIKVYGSYTSPYFHSIAEKNHNYVVASYDTNMIVKTPAGSNVSVEYRTAEFDRGYIDKLNKEYDQKYSKAIRLADASRRYNCHTYAWHESSSYWMEDPSAYMRDGSYQQTYNSKVGDKVYYVGVHSAIYAKEGNVFKSKWGIAGVYLHKYDDCPYSRSQIKYYTKN